LQEQPTGFQFFDAIDRLALFRAAFQIVLWIYSTFCYLLKTINDEMGNNTLQISCAIFAFFSLSGFSCITERSYGPVERESRNIGSFSEIEVSHGINVFITVGNRTSLEVETSEDLIKKLITEVRGDKLKIYFDGNFIWAKTANVYVQAEEISKISASGGADVIGEDEITGRDLELSASGGSDIKLEVDVDNMEVEVSGGADVELSGRTNYLEANTSGGSDLKAYDLIAQTSRLEASGGSDIKVFVEEDIDARASGGADIKYRGNPKNVQTRDSSGGDVTKVN
jgi:hypothetical protein